MFQFTTTTFPPLYLHRPPTYQEAKPQKAIAAIEQTTTICSVGTQTNHINQLSTWLALSRWAELFWWLWPGMERGHNTHQIPSWFGVCSHRILRNVSNLSIYLLLYLNNETEIIHSWFASSATVWSLQSDWNACKPEPARTIGLRQWGTYFQEALSSPKTLNIKKILLTYFCILCLLLWPG